MKFSFLGLLILGVHAVTSTSFAQIIAGHIDSISLQNADVQISGWACEIGDNASISVDISAGEVYTSRVLLENIKADVTSEPAVSTACKTQKTPHRFRAFLPPSKWMPHNGKRIYIQGFSSRQNIKSVIANPQKLKLPSISTSSQIAGHIDSVSLVGTGLQVSGWACKRGNADSAVVHIYAGGPIETGTFVKSLTANLTAEAAVSTACNTSETKYRFKALLSPSEWQPHKGKTIYIQGIVSDRDDKSTTIGTIAKSGQFNFPSANAGIQLSSLSYKENADLVIPEGFTVTIDRNINVRHLIINGILSCPKSGQYSLSAKAISVYGIFECGSSSSRFTGKLDVLLRPGLQLESKHGPLGERALLVHGGGTLQLYGSSENAGWQRIAKTSDVGSQSVRLSKPVAWKPGDVAVLSSTSFDMNEAEQLKVASVSKDGLTVTFQESLKFSHWGELQNYKSLGKDWILDERAKIANLTRNIRVLPFEGDFLKDQLGGHVMVMVGGKAYVDSVELIHMGRMGEMARYPFHWHMVGNAEGQFFVNSSVHDSFQRCVTIHATNYALVENNVCYNHYGHGYFFEQGSERKNILKGNLGLVSKKPLPNRHLLESDVKGTAGRFPAPSTFWISNPDNTIEGNVAAGSEGTGFWMAFENKNLCNKDLCSNPLVISTLAFNNNEAHSSKVGITWDGAPGTQSAENPRNSLDRLIESAHYFPSKKPIFNNLVAFKNYEAGLYFRGNAAEFRSTIVADNAWSLFFAYSQAVVDSVVIGQSRNISAKDKDRLKLSRKGAGIVAYDGPFELSNVAFLEFPENTVMHQGKDITPYPIIGIGGANRFENKVRGLQFSPEPLKRIHFDFSAEIKSGWSDSPYSVSVRDLDGSLTGSAGALIVPANSFNQQGNCQIRQNWGAMLCFYNLALISFRVLDPNEGQQLKIDSNTLFFLPEVNGQKIYNTISDMPGHYHNKVNAVIGSNKIYTLHPSPEFSKLKRFSVVMQAEGSDVVGPVVQLKGFGKCALDKGLATSNLNQLAASTESSYHQDNGDLYVKLKTTTVSAWHRHALMSHVTFANMAIKCQ